MTPDFQYPYNDDPDGRVEAVNAEGQHQRDAMKTVIPRFKREEQRMAPRMWLSGGSYTGQGGGHIPVHLAHVLLLHVDGDRKSVYM